jgi:2,4-dienoyl-CoA reductase-like NADH-dependent reductase (Old Yellow Enzyme family)
MSLHQRFNFKNREEIEAKILSLGLDIPLDTDLSPLGRKVNIGNLQAPNSLAIHPLECRDSLPDGSPGEMTFRRYKRFAEGGAGQIWFEATSFTEEGKSGQGQLILNMQTLPEFKRLCSHTRQSAISVYGAGHQIINILELTHSGRHSALRPVIAVHNKILDGKSNLPEDCPLITDGELEELEDQYVDAARLAVMAGFDGVDVKACHGYLAAELLGARQRPGMYGGSFENRTRFILNVVDKIRSKFGNDLAITTRLSAFDGVRNGWGMQQNTDFQENLEEPVRLVKLLYEKGVRVINISAGNPYVNPSIGRPFDRPMNSGAIPAEHPLEGVARLFKQVRQIQEAVPGMAVVGTGYSWLRQYLGFSAAANIRRGWVTVAGVGREALAYPDFARDLLTRGELDPKKTCVTCSLCSQLMREGGPTGCVIFDREVYRPVYQQKCKMPFDD